jgi:hypothetical protein
VDKLNIGRAKHGAFSPKKIHVFIMPFGEIPLMGLELDIIYRNGDVGIGGIR